MVVATTVLSMRRLRLRVTFGPRVNSVTRSNKRCIAWTCSKFAQRMGVVWSSSGSIPTRRTFCSGRPASMRDFEPDAVRPGMIDEQILQKLRAGAAELGESGCPVASAEGRETLVTIAPRRWQSKCRSTCGQTSVVRRAGRISC